MTAVRWRGRVGEVAIVFVWVAVDLLAVDLEWVEGSSVCVDTEIVSDNGRDD
jgi:hypothetical protein